jgi:hypothetical protein
MNERDLQQLDRLLSSAREVFCMRDIYEGATGGDVIGLRHDVDDNEDSLATAVKIAAWEAECGYRSTFFMLHSASYWTTPAFPAALEEISAYGHEIGIHANAIATALRDGGDPDEILATALAQLRGYGFPVIGVAPHGDELCHRVCFVNDEMFAECARPEMGEPDRLIAYDGRRFNLKPRPLADFGLEYETYRLPRGRYLSDSGGTWNVPPETVADGPGQLHILQHPDWWNDAFLSKETTDE